MKRQLRPILAAVVLLCAPLAWSQSSFPDSSLNSSSGPQQMGSSSDPSQGGAGDQLPGSGDQTQNGSGDQTGVGGPQATFSHPEKLPGLSLFGEELSHTGYAFTMSTGTVGQYVSGYSGTPGYWDDLTLFTAGINIVQTRPTLMWSLGYSGGINTTLGSSYSTYTNLNQTANAHIIWAVSSRWQLRVKDVYFYSDNPFQPFFTFLAEPTPNNPNPVQYFPNTVVEQNQGNIDLTYMIGPHDSIDFYGSESFQHFLAGAQVQGSLPGIGSLWNSTTYAGGAFYQHTFSPRLSAGEGYVFTAMDFGHGASRAGVQMFESFVNYRLSPRILVNGWVGPEVTGTKDLVPLICFPTGCLIEVEHQQTINIAEGATLTWSAPHRNSFAVQTTHSITNGGGLFGAVKYYQATASYSRPLTRNWNFAAGALYGHSDSISIYQGDDYLHSTQATVTFARKINEAWNLNAYYVYIHQKQNYAGYSGLPETVATSGIGLTVQYAWNHSLGR
jgi:hypothetical protein